MPRVFEHPETVKLRIAKEHIDNFFAMKQRGIDEVLTSMARRVNEVRSIVKGDLENRYSLGDHTLDAYFLDLIKYGAELEILENSFVNQYNEICVQQTVPNGPLHSATILSHKIKRKVLLGQIEAKTALWHKQQLNELEEELRVFLK